mgnify:CR=1 FL=1
MTYYVFCLERSVGFGKVSSVQLFVDTVLTVGGKEVRVKSSLQLLKEEAMRLDLPAYAEACGIPAETLAGLAKELASHGKKASVIAHGGMMSGSGFYNAYALLSINALLGNINWKGGFVANGPRLTGRIAAYGLHWMAWHHHFWMKKPTLNSSCRLQIDWPVCICMVWRVPACRQAVGGLVDH